VAKGGAGIRVKLDGELVFEPCEFQAERLAARSGADLDNPVLRHLTSLPTHTRITSFRITAPLRRSEGGLGVRVW